MKYINDFIKAKCAPDLLALKLFPNAKEITETAAMYWFVTEQLQKYGVNRNNNVLLFEIGCGVVPRTAAFFAYRTQWYCHAIDPKLRDPQKDWGDKIYTHKTYDNQFDPNFEYYTTNGEIDDMYHNNMENAKAVIVVSVHGHGNPFDFYKRIKHTHKAVFEMPCCLPPTIKEGRFKIDKGILSPKNAIYWTGTEELFNKKPKKGEE